MLLIKISDIIMCVLVPGFAMGLYVVLYISYREYQRRQL